MSTPASNPEPTGTDPTGTDPTDLVSAAEERLAQVERLPDPAAREAATELVRALVELYGRGLVRAAGVAVRTGGDPVREELAGDELISHLLLLHDAHPLDLATRVARAVAAAGPRLGLAPEVLEVDPRRVRLRLAEPESGAGDAAGSRPVAPTAAARAALEEAVRAAAPEVEHVELAEPPAAPTLIPLSSVGSAA